MEGAGDDGGRGHGSGCRGAGGEGRDRGGGRRGGHRLGSIGAVAEPAPQDDEEDRGHGSRTDDVSGPSGTSGILPSPSCHRIRWLRARARAVAGRLGRRDVAPDPLRHIQGRLVQLPDRREYPIQAALCDRGHLTAVVIETCAGQVGGAVQRGGPGLGMYDPRLDRHPGLFSVPVRAALVVPTPDLHAVPVQEGDHVVVILRSWDLEAIGPATADQQPDPAVPASSSQPCEAVGGGVSGHHREGRAGMVCQKLLDKGSRCPHEHSHPPGAECTG